MKHTSYRGVAIDMAALTRENEKTVALGNMGVNARGDRLGKDGKITKTADQMARENHRKQTAIINSGIKGPMPEAPVSPLEQDKRPAAKSVKTKPREVELPSGDIVIEEDPKQ